MKVVLIVLLGVVIWNSDDSRHFVAVQLDNVSAFVRPSSY